MRSMRLWQRKNGLWYVTFYRGKHQSLKTKDEAQARIIFKRLEKEYLQGRLVRLERGELKPFGEFIAEYLNTRIGKAKNTCRADRLALNKFMAFYGNKPMFGITSRKMSQFRASLEASKLKPRSLNNHIKHLRVAFKAAIKWGYLQGNPLDELKQFKVDERKDNFLTKKEVIRLLNEADKHPDMRAAIALQVYTGMSRAEVMSAMTFECDRIIYRRVKTGRLIAVPIAEGLKPYIEHLKGIQKAVPWKNPRTYSKHFETIVKEAGLQGVTPHKLRHTFASMLLDEGVDIQTISELLGHRDSGITARFYLHLRDEKKREAVNRLNYGL